MSNSKKTRKFSFETWVGWARKKEKKGTRRLDYPSSSQNG
jgi:hypothetical protein